MPQIVPIIEDDRFFIKSFIIDETLNLNYWATTDQAIDTYLSTFIGQPFVITPDFGHPDANSGDELLINQEKFRVGNIIEVGRDSSNGKAWAISEITNKEAQRQIQDGEVRFVSPSILFNADTDMISIDGKDIVTKFSAAHIAGVKEPAYGMQKAQIKGTCGGSLGTCIPQLQAVQASIEKTKCGKAIVIHEGKTVRVVKNASECIEKCLRLKAEQGLVIDDEAIARCFSECEFNATNGDNPNSSDVNVNINLVEGQQDPNITSCTKCETGKCQCSSNKDKNKDNSMTAEDDKEEKKSNEEELEDKRKEEAKKAEDDKQEELDTKKADEKKDAPLDAEEDEEDEKKDARIRALEAELRAEKTSFVETILAAKKAGGHILEAEESSARKSLEAETLVTLKQLAAAYTDKVEASKGKSIPYSVLNYQQASTSKGDDFLKLIGAKSE